MYSDNREDTVTTNAQKKKKMVIKTTNDSTQQRTFSSLEEIENYKEEIRQSIHNDEKHIGELWHNLFHNEDRHAPKTTVQKMIGMVNIGSGVLDGLILGWKLYRKFKKGRR